MGGPVTGLVRHSRFALPSPAGSTLEGEPTSFRRFPFDRCRLQIGSVAAMVLAVASLSWVVAMPAIAAQGDCGQPVTTGASPAASDCLFILGASVGAQQCAPECVCDTNGSGGISASDALVCLAIAVGQSVALDCPCDVAAACDLLVNGGFDLPVVASPHNGWSYLDIDFSGGWYNSGGNPGPYFTLNSDGQPSTDPTLSQAVTGLSPGASYRITGDYRSFAPASGNPAKPDAFAVAVTPLPLDHDSTIVLALPRPSPNPLAWTAFSVDFVASSSTVTVSFIAERNGDDSSFDVDNLCMGAR
jgi:hypothetical protein